jgi:ABC-2 type transport system permease protein
MAKKIFNLSLQLAKAGFKLRNEGSYLGILWYLLNPLLLFILILFVFSKNLGADIPNYPMYILIGIIMFNLFSQSTTDSSKLFVRDYRELVKSINFPKEALVLGSTIKFLFSHIFEFALLVFFMFFFGGYFPGILFYFFILTFFIIFIYSWSLIISSVTVYFNDLENIWAFFIRLVWLATPIFYSVEKGSSLFIANLFNPFYYFITISRDILIYGTIPQTWMMLGAIFFSLLSFLIGLIIFNKLKYKFPELV